MRGKFQLSLLADGDLRYTPEGLAVWRAVTGIFPRQNGDSKENKNSAKTGERGPVQWVEVLAFGALAEKLGELDLKKFTHLLIEGEMVLNVWGEKQSLRIVAQRAWVSLGSAAYLNSGAGSKGNKDNPSEGLIEDDNPPF